jgi:hypothetical protein
MKKQSQPTPEDVILLGETTLMFMLSAVYNESDPLNNRNYYGECGGALNDVKHNPEAGDKAVYVYYYPKRDITIMTTVKGDVIGALGSSAGFEGKVSLETQKTENKQ